MKIGVPKEIKNNEFRVAITPYGVKELISNGHEVFIEKNAGTNSGNDPLLSSTVSYAIQTELLLIIASSNGLCDAK